MVFPGEKKQGFQASLRNSINGQSNWIYKTYKFWRIRVFTTSAEHVFLLWSKNLPKNFALENIYIKP